VSARRVHRPAATASRTIIAATALALALSACGVKSAPKRPDGSNYPQAYPASGDAKAEPEDKAKKDDVPSPVPQYDYPNRPPSR